MATIGELLTAGTARLRTAGSESPRLDAELLLGWAVGAARTAVIAHPEANVGPDGTAAFETALARREAGEPVAYIRGVKEFHGLAFVVDRRALIPRPETELLVAEGEREVAWRLTSAPRPTGARHRSLLSMTGEPRFDQASQPSLEREGRMAGGRAGPSPHARLHANGARPRPPGPAGGGRPLRPRTGAAVRWRCGGGGG